MRWKLVWGNLVVVILMGIIGWFVVRAGAGNALVDDIDPSVDRGAALLDAVRQQDGDRLLNATEDAAQSPALAAVYASDSQSALRDAAFTFVDGLARQMATLPRRGRPAELVLVTDTDGRVITRNIERNQDNGRALATEFPAVAAALRPPSGRPTLDYIHYGEQGWLEAAIVPVVVGGQLRGALVVGYAMADSAARSDAQRLGVDVAFVFRTEHNYLVQSLSCGQQREKEELQTWANAAGTNFQTLTVGRQHRTINLGGNEYRVVVGPMPGAFNPTLAGAILLRSVTDASAPAGSVALVCVILSILGGLMVIGFNLYFANYMSKPIEQIEDGLLQIINGNQNFRLELQHEELGGIVDRINQLVSELTGEEETDEQGRISLPPGGSGGGRSEG